MNQNDPGKDTQGLLSTSIVNPPPFPPLTSGTFLVLPNDLLGLGRSPSIYLAPEENRTQKCWEVVLISLVLLDIEVIWKLPRAGSGVSGRAEDSPSPAVPQPQIPGSFSLLISAK